VVLTKFTRGLKLSLYFARDDFQLADLIRLRLCRMAIPLMGMYCRFTQTVQPLSLKLYSLLIKNLLAVLDQVFYAMVH